MKCIVRIVLAAALALAFAPLKSFSQPSFEVASVKANGPGRPSGPPRVAADGHRFVASNATLLMLLQFAYRPDDNRTLRNAEIIGAPKWAGSEFFNIEAKIAGDAAPISTQDMQGMVRSLLADRFQLKAHWEKRDNMETFNLVVAKGGPKLKLSEDQTPPAIDAQPSVPFNPSALPPRGQTRTIAKPTGGTIVLTFSGAAVPITPDLLSALQSYARRPVVDRTGLKGLYDFSLEFFLDPGTAGPAPTAAAADPVGLSLFPALQDELGLSLEPSKGTVQVLIIDSVQRPSEN